ncbi:hypothetical protein [uncultured Aquimarina sp.]|uniref:hypothetical protein n=1 Tax=uncultured Aquimarina sp. TaxID=575652 RepID=UPI002627896C|nr:hypothetical protein [uncultured Aquimarina sp.]
MKKIKLLVVAAVFTIGIQSCSTDEIGIEEENIIEENGLSKRQSIIINNNDNNIPDGPIRKVYLYYPPDMSFQDRLDYFEYFRENVLFITFIQLNDGCENVDFFLGILRDEAPKPEVVVVRASNDVNEDVPDFTEGSDTFPFDSKSNPELIGLENFCAIINRIEGN